MAAVKEHFAKLLAENKCSELPVEREPLLVTETMHPAEAFKYLAEQGIRACPVRSEAGNEIVGTLDLRDSVGYVVESFLANNPKTSALSKMASFTGKSKGFIKATTTDIKEIARVRPFPILPADTTLFDVSTALAAGNHIIGIGGGPDERCGLSRVVTQGMLLKFVAPALSNVPMPVKAAMTAPVTSIRVTDPALRGFDVMASKGISALAAVDENGVIIHNMSASDVKIYFGTSDFEPMQDLNMPIEDFLAKKRTAAAKQKTMAPISVCKEEDDLSNVVTKLCKTGYHRVWVVKEKKPIGVLSLTDVFKKLSPSGKGKDNCCIS